MTSTASFYILYNCKVAVACRIGISKMKLERDICILSKIEGTSQQPHRSGANIAGLKSIKYILGIKYILYFFRCFIHSQSVNIQFYEFSFNPPTLYTHLSSEHILFVKGHVGHTWRVSVDYTPTFKR